MKETIKDLLSMKDPLSVVFVALIVTTLVLMSYLFFAPDIMDIYPIGDHLLVETKSGLTVDCGHVQEDDIAMVNDILTCNHKH
jgi:hypothetical protein